MIKVNHKRVVCRCCDKRLNNGEDVAILHSHRNGWQDIHFCLDCSEEIGELFKQHKEKNAAN